MDTQNQILPISTKEILVQPRIELKWPPKAGATTMHNHIQCTYVKLLPTSL